VEVTLQGVTKKYGDFVAVQNLDLRIKSGALHFLLGPSGCGKTTTLRMLAGLETPSSGKILFGGKDVTKLQASERGIGMVFQNYALWPHMTVEKNISYALSLRKLSTDEQRKRLTDVLAVTQLTKFSERLPGQLSGGQQQRVALARALAVQPSLILLDEPLSNLDAKLRLEMRDNICDVHRKTGITMVYVTHDQKEALSMGTEVSIMHAGHLVQSDTPRALYNLPHTPFIASFIGETNLISARYIGRDGDFFIADTAIGRVAAARCTAVNPKEGQEVVISIRPEAVGVAKDADHANTFEAKIHRITYLGESEQLQLLAADGLQLKATFYNVMADDNLAEGQKVRFVLPPENALLLPAQADLSSGT
jgi:iron(III) transport system ATP-binding protein